MTMIAQYNRHTTESRIEESSAAALSITCFNKSRLRAELSSYKKFAEHRAIKSMTTAGGYGLIMKYISFLKKKHGNQDIRQFPVT
jgi:hypothetical protein